MDDDDRLPEAASRLLLIPRQVVGETQSTSVLYPMTTTTTHDDLNGSNPPVEPLLPPSNRKLALQPWQIALILTGSLLIMGICATAWILLRTRRRLRQDGTSTMPSFTSKLGLSRKEPNRRWRASVQRGSRSLESREDLGVSVIHKDHEEEITWDHEDDSKADRKSKVKDKGNKGKVVETKVKLTRLVKKQPRPSTGLTVASSVTGRSRATFQTNATDTSYAGPLSTEYDPVVTPSGPAVHPTQLSSSVREASGTDNQIGPPHHGSPPVRQSDDGWGMGSSSVAHTIRGSFEQEGGHHPQAQAQLPIRSPQSTAFDTGHPGRHGLGQYWQSNEDAVSSNGDHSSPPNSGGSLLLHGNTNVDAPDGTRGLAFSGWGLFGSGHYRTNHERTK